MTKQRRLAVRIPTIGWQANILSENIALATAKIANLSAGGAYLLTKAEYQPGSLVSLDVKSAQVLFSVTAVVLRNEPFGIAVRFLDLGKSAKSSILEMVSQSLSRRKHENTVAEKIPMCKTVPLKFNCDL